MWNFRGSKEVDVLQKMRWCLPLWLPTTSTQGIVFVCFYTRFLIFSSAKLIYSLPWVLQTVTSGPYLCHKHTKCYSCGSKVPGNGQSLRYSNLLLCDVSFWLIHYKCIWHLTVPFKLCRWFLGHTCCDACGRLFVKGNYCPVCLKVCPCTLSLLLCSVWLC